MATPLYIENSILIAAPVSKVWEALTDSHYTKQYMFGCETVSDWTLGSSLIWRMEYEGQPFIPVTGYILKIDAPHHLTYSVFDPNSTMENIPENYLNVSYDLTTEGEFTLLKVRQGDYNTVANGEKRYQDAYNNGLGWSPILEQIKKILEA